MFIGKVSLLVALAPKERNIECFCPHTLRSYRAHAWNLAESYKHLAPPEQRLHNFPFNQNRSLLSADFD